MTQTPLQQAAKNIILRWDSPLWKDVAPTAEYVNELRKALDAELQQSAEPVAWLKTWNSVGNAREGMKRVELTPECETWLRNMFPTVQPLYLHPPQQAVTSGERAELIAALRSDFNDDRTDFDNIKYAADMLEADAGWEQVARAQDAKIHAMLGKPGGIEKLREVLDKAKAQQAKQVPMTVVMQQALNALQELWLLGDRAAAIANPAIEALKIAIQHPANKPLENSEIDALGLLGVEQFPILFKQVPWGNELKPYVRRLARAIEAHRGIGG